ncbi:iron donor protein CyaY [Aestuariirhabdus litorea]|uniref:Iron-sulfur cluster assembly protein CyaY n=1 Tax=Aestuariirhabdus litorea TaxID=2528527 RepID=A0A3P3VM55_9GAMM|nr:iron donor protein CyaY [Aestuariirhabdus litorea]RRJ82958.1 iron donor protein CyaY [Aestuariirhabdus litorea]RWW93117.1 iron donor protein CyaY [Endozoicomonadaceae bacterium GTF-13]
MSESSTNQLLDELMMAIEDAIEEAGLDIDYETAAGILTLTCEEGSQVILSRQAASGQLWMAARSGGFHFERDEQGEWRCTRSGEPFRAMLNRCLSEQSGEPVDLSW